MAELKCTKCGNTMSFYTKERYKGECDVFFNTDGSDAENGDMYAYAEHTYRSKFVFCAECNAKVGKVELVIEFWRPRHKMEMGWTDDGKMVESD